MTVPTLHDEMGLPNVSLGNISSPPNITCRDKSSNLAGTPVTHANGHGKYKAT